MPREAFEFALAAIPEPERNAPCICGSGRKFKSCCRNLSQVPLNFEPKVIWNGLATRMGAEH